MNGCGEKRCYNLAHTSGKAANAALFFALCGIVTGTSKARVLESFREAERAARPERRHALLGPRGMTAHS